MRVQEGLGQVLGITLPSAFLLSSSPSLLLGLPSGYGLEGQGSQAAGRRQSNSRKKERKLQTLAIWEDRKFLLELSGGNGRGLTGYHHYYIREEWKTWPACVGG